MSDEKIPPGYHFNTPEQRKRMEEVMRIVSAEVLRAGFGAMACVFATSDGTITASLAADASKPAALASLIVHGADVLRTTLERMQEGKGDTKVVVSL